MHTLQPADLKIKLKVMPLVFRGMVRVTVWIELFGVESFSTQMIQTTSILHSLESLCFLVEKKQLKNHDGRLADCFLKFTMLVLWIMYQNRLEKISPKMIYQSSKILSKKINSPITSSVGRFFDAVSSLLNICNKSNYEGQAAMMLEFAADENENGYIHLIFRKEILKIDWQPIINYIINDLRNNVPYSIISASFITLLSE